MSYLRQLQILHNLSKKYPRYLKAFSNKKQYHSLPIMDIGTNDPAQLTLQEMSAPIVHGLTADGRDVFCICTISNEGGEEERPSVHILYYDSSGFHVATQGERLFPFEKEYRDIAVDCKIIQDLLRNEHATVRLLTQEEIDHFRAQQE